MVDKSEILDAVFGRGLTKSAAARELGVSAAYVGRVVKEREGARDAPQSVTVTTVQHEHALLDNRVAPDEPAPKWRSEGGVLAFPEQNHAPPEDPEKRAWALSPQEREQIHYGVVKMRNPPANVGACFGVSPEVVAFVVEIVGREKGAA